MHHLVSLLTRACNNVLQLVQAYLLHVFYQKFVSDHAAVLFVEDLP